MSVCRHLWDTFRSLPSLVRRSLNFSYGSLPIYDRNIKIYYSTVLEMKVKCFILGSMAFFFHHACAPRKISFFQCPEIGRSYLMTRLEDPT